MNKFSHIDLRVNNLENAMPFYEKFLSALGFTRTFHSEKWKVFAAEGDLPSVAYFAITEDANHQPNGNLIGFWAEDREEVDRIANWSVKLAGKSSTAPGYFRSVRLITPCILRILLATNTKLSIG